MHADNLDFAVRLSKAIAAQFGKDCEVVVYDLKSCPAEHSIIAIENGHVSGRHLGDGPSHIVLDALKTKNGRAKDRLAFLTKGRNGKILKSSNVYLRDENGEIIGMLAINFDISLMVAMKHALKDLTKEGPSGSGTSDTTSVTALLDDLIDQSIQLVGKVYETEDATKCEKDIASLLTQAISAFEAGLKARMEAEKDAR